MPAKKTAKPAKTTGLTAGEKAAMKDLMAERKRGKGNGPADLKAAIAAMVPAERTLAQRIHDIVVAAVPNAEQKTWYGFPAYCMDDKVVCFFKPGAKFKDRYCTFGFNTPAKLDDGGMWATSFAVVKPSAADEAKLTALVRKAFGGG
ncbi:MAG: hypothetical protein QOD77_1064 [Thermoplasmata archaeon]|jgi:uncharacterized protein YdhG (YjbR/CyaY superfamily)|nr:hypothetical protein [Thermoplasmata archaeon]